MMPFDWTVELALRGERELVGEFWPEYDMEILSADESWRLTEFDVRDPLTALRF